MCHLNGAKVSADIILGSWGRGCEEELGGNGVRAHVVDFAHVNEEALGEDWDYDIVCPVEEELGKLGDGCPGVHTC
jgi:hypothetical protein